MNENRNSVSTPAPDTRGLDTRGWIPRLILAVIVGEAIWGLLVSLTRSLVLPALVRFIGSDPHSPLYLGKGDFDFPAIFSSILELCFAGITAAILSYWPQPRPARVRVKATKRAQVAAKISIPSISPNGMPSILDAPVTPTPVNAPAVPAETPVAATPVMVPSISPPAPQPPAPLAQTAASSKPATPVKPQKPKKPKEVYYNIVGEPISPTEDDD